MEVLIYPHPVLRRGGQAITEFGPELRETADRMMAAMYEQGGVGLAAPQVGIELKLLVLNPTGSPDDRSGERVLCNPRIVRKKKREFGEEGCLSFPGIQAEVERHVEITVVYQDLDGQEQSLKCDGWLSRIVQHEIDHLEGVFFVDRLTPTEKMRVKAQLLELEERYKAGA
ncbi:MAG TPA: peptide deformylase [bacterium]|nr:peptide deformylase [bacterium]